MVQLHNDLTVHESCAATSYMLHLNGHITTMS